MPFLFKIDAGNGIAYLKGIGEITSEEIQKLTLKLVQDPKWQLGFAILCDYREILQYRVSTEEVRSLAKFHQHLGHQVGKSRLAIIAPHNVVFGLNRMWEFLVEGIEAQIRVCRTLEEAQEWIEKPLEPL